MGLNELHVVALLFSDLSLPPNVNLLDATYADVHFAHESLRARVSLLGQRSIAVALAKRHSRFQLDSIQCRLCVGRDLWNDNGRYEYDGIPFLEDEGIHWDPRSQEGSRIEIKGWNFGYNPPCRWHDSSDSNVVDRNHLAFLWHDWDGAVSTFPCSQTHVALDAVTHSVVGLSRETAKLFLDASVALGHVEAAAKLPDILGQERLLHVWSLWEFAFQSLASFEAAAVSGANVSDVCNWVEISNGERLLLLSPLDYAISSGDADLADVAMRTKCEFSLEAQVLTSEMIGSMVLGDDITLEAAEASKRIFAATEVVSNFFCRAGMAYAIPLLQCLGRHHYGTGKIEMVNSILLFLVDLPPRMLQVLGHIIFGAVRAELTSDILVGSKLLLGATSSHSQQSEADGLCAIAACSIEDAEKHDQQRQDEDSQKLHDVDVAIGDDEDMAAALRASDLESSNSELLCTILEESAFEAALPPRTFAHMRNQLWGDEQAASGQRASSAPVASGRIHSQRIALQRSHSCPPMP